MRSKPQILEFAWLPTRNSIALEKQFYRLTTKNTGIGSYDLTITRGDSADGGLEYLPATLASG